MTTTIDELLKNSVPMPLPPLDARYPLPGTAPTKPGSVPIPQTKTRVTPVSGGYSEIPFIPFVLGLGIVSAPIGFLESTNNRSWIWRYVFLIVLMLVVFYWRGLENFSRYYSSLTKGL